MIGIVEEIAPASHVRAELAYFQTHSFAELIATVRVDPAFSESLALLSDDLCKLIERCRDDLSAPDTAAIIDAWDRWCERYEALEHPAFEEQLLDVFIALPS